MQSHTSVEGSKVCVHPRVPPLQLVVPAAQTPSRPVEQAWPPPGLPSSVAPSQLLSKPSQVSDEAETSWLQTTSPPLQLVVPVEQTPARPVAQAWPLPGLPSSVAPSQSSSVPSQV